MAIFFHWTDAHEDVWRKAFQDAGIESEILFEKDLSDSNAENVEYVIAWAPPQGVLKRFSNLKYIFSIGAGVTHITDDPDAPLDIPIVRLQDEMLILDMSCHILHWVLHFHRFYYQYGHYQSEKKWLRHRYCDNSAKRVGVMGLGQTGQDACRRLADLDFDVTGWSRSPKQIEDVRCLDGDDQFDTLLESSDILVNLLPLTAKTENILNADSFNKMPEGSFIINCSRGASINDADLLAALDSGQIEAAALDVFRIEPLPEGDPYWNHQKVFVTPHAAAPSNEVSAARFITGQIRKSMDGGTPSPVVDIQRGY